MKNCFKSSKQQLETNNMTRQQSKQLGTNIGIFFLALGMAILIFPSFKLLAYIATLVNGVLA